MEKINNLEEFVEKFDAMKKQNPLDLSSDQDLVFAIMNLISIEEHLIFTGLKTEKNSYYDAMLTVRDIRKKSLQRIIKEYEGEIWCTSKHLLAACMRFMEVGTKQMSLGNKTDAYELYSQAYEMYCLFWGFNMKLIDSKDLKWDEGKANLNVPTANDKKPEATKTEDTSKPKSTMSKLGAFLKKAVNCCIE